MQITNQQDTYSWKQFFKDVNTLTWYDVFTSFVFRFMAKTSEPLLAAGVIVSAIDFLQRGQLLAHNPTLSLWWSIAQGVAMEVSVGPVLLCALEAKEDGDALKAKFYAALSVILALVGGAMLLMQFGLSVAGLTESDITPYILWPLFVIRTFASIGYIALSCTKHKRFSGVSPKVVIIETTKAFDEALAKATEMQVATNAALQRIETSVQQQLHLLQQEVNGRLARVESSFGERFTEMERLTEQRLADVYAGFVQEVSTVRVTLEEQSKVIRLIPERTATEPSVRQFQSPNPLSVKAAPKAENPDFDKATFVRQCLTESPEMTIGDIQRRATEIGQTISGGYISDIRKDFRSSFAESGKE